jgi:Tfp pilus assembly protein PilP
MRQSARLLLATLLGLAACPAFASDDAAAWHAQQQADARASAAQQALSERYAAIWSTLDAAQKTRFSARERAWLNSGRQEELQACIARLGQRTDVLARICDADVIERHLGALVVPQRVASSR